MDEQKKSLKEKFVERMGKTGEWCGEHVGDIAMFASAIATVTAAIIHYYAKCKADAQYVRIDIKVDPDRVDFDNLKELKDILSVEG